MLLQVAVGRGDLFGDSLCLLDLLEQRRDAFLDLFETAGAVLVAADLLAEIVEPLQRGVGLLAHLVERLAGLRQLRRAAGHLRQHGAQHRPLFLRLGDERVELVLLRLLGCGGAEKGVKHGGVLAPALPQRAAGPAENRPWVTDSLPGEPPERRRFCPSIGASAPEC